MRFLLIAMLAGTLCAAELPSLRGEIARALERGEKKIVLTAPRYADAGLVDLKNLEDFELDGNGATLVNTSLGIAIRISGCTKLTIRNLTIDYDPLPFTQAVVTKAEGRRVEFEVEAGYPDLDARYASSRLHLFDAEGRFWKKVPDIYGQSEIRTPRRGLFVMSETIPVAAGDKVALNYRSSYGIQIIDSEKTTLEDVNLLSAPGLGIIGRFNRGGDTFRRVKIMRGPKPAGAVAERLLSTSADGLNYAYCHSGIVIEECDFSYMGDDSVNLHSALMPVAAVIDERTFDTVRPVRGEHFPQVVRDGDEARFLDAKHYAVQNRGILKSIRVSPRQYDRETAKRYFHHGDGNCTAFEVTLREPVKLAEGMFFDIPALASSHFLIRNNYFHDHRGRALRIMASDGEISGNRIERIKHSGISVGAEYGFWREAGWVENVRIEHNSLKEIGYGMLTRSDSYAPGAIAVFARLEDYSDSYMGNSNIQINGNRVSGCAGAGIFINRAREVEISGNRLENVLDSKGPYGGEQFGFTGAAPVWIIKSEVLEKP